MGVVVKADSQPLQPALEKLTRNPYIFQHNVNPTAFVDLLVDDFWGLAQGTTHRHHQVWRTLFHALEKVFQPMDTNNTSNQKEVLYLKKLDEGYFTCSTC